MMWRRIWIALALAFCLSLSLVSDASAHPMPVNRGTVNVVEKRAYVVLSLPVSAFRAIADCSDGVLTTKELKRNQKALRKVVRKQLRIESEGTATFKKILFNLPTGYGHQPDSSGEILVMVVAQFEAPPRTIVLTSGLWGEKPEPLKIRATRSRRKKKEEAQTETLTKKDPSARFFAR